MLYELLDESRRGWPRSFGRVDDVGTARAADWGRSRGARSIPVRAAAAEPPPADVETESAEPFDPPVEPAEADEAIATDRLRRAARELEAAKSRVEREAKRLAQQTRSQLIDKLLPVLGNLDRSIAAANGDADGSLLEGLELVRSQFEDVLLGYGLERVASLGHRFDPSVHEAIAVQQVSDAEQDGVIVDELEPGYRLDGQLLRAAKVRVGRVA